MMTDDLRDLPPPSGQAMADFLAAGEPRLISRIRTSRRPRAVARRRRFVVGGLSVAILAGCGAAYASGHVPSFLQREAADYSREIGSDTAPAITEFVDLTLPDGSRFGAWRWAVDGRVCVSSADNWDGRDRTGMGGTRCGPDTGANMAWTQWAAGRLKDPGNDREVPEPWFPVVFGYAGDPSITAVRLEGTVTKTGERVDSTHSVDPDTGGFGVVLPGQLSNRQLFDSRGTTRYLGVMLSFIDHDGRVVGDSVHLPSGG